MKILIHQQDKRLTNICNSFHNVLKVILNSLLIIKIFSIKIGQLLTNAMWMRQFVCNHPLYCHDSVVNEQIQYDLMWLIQQMANDEKSIPLIRPSNMKSHTELKS